VRRRADSEEREKEREREREKERETINRRRIDRRGHRVVPADYCRFRFGGLHRPHRITERRSAGNRRRRGSPARRFAARKQLKRAAGNVIAAPRSRRYISRLSSVPPSVPAAGHGNPLAPELRRFAGQIQSRGSSGSEGIIQALPNFGINGQARVVRSRALRRRLKQMHLRLRGRGQLVTVCNIEKVARVSLISRAFIKVLECRQATPNGRRDGRRERYFLDSRSTSA